MSWQDTKRKLDAKRARTVDEQVEAHHAARYPVGCPNLCEACVRRLAGKKFGVDEQAQLEAQAQLADISEVLGLQTFTIVATMPDGSERRANLFAETWQAAGRQAEILFLGAETIVIQGRHN